MDLRLLLDRAENELILSKVIFRISEEKNLQNVFEKLKKLVTKGILDVELLRIYEKILMKADSLLGIYETEKNKRGKYTYRKLAQANHDPAKESLDNASLFFRHIYNLCN